MKNLHCFAVTERVDAPHAWPGSRRTRSGACNPALCHKTRLLLLQARQHRWPRCEESPHRCGAGRLRRHRGIVQEASHGSTEAHQRHGSTTPSGSVLQLQRRVWPVWRRGVGIRAEHPGRTRTPSPLARPSLAHARLCPHVGGYAALTLATCLAEQLNSSQNIEGGLLSHCPPLTKASATPY